MIIWKFINARGENCVVDHKKHAHLRSHILLSLPNSEGWQREKTINISCWLSGQKGIQYRNKHSKDTKGSQTVTENITSFSAGAFLIAQYVWGCFALDKKDNVPLCKKYSANSIQSVKPMNSEVCLSKTPQNYIIHHSSTSDGFFLTHRM